MTFNSQQGSLSRVRVVSAEIPAPTDGQVWYNSTTDKFRMRENGASYDILGAGAASAALTSIITTAGSTFTLTSTATDETLAWSTAGSLIFKDSTAALRLQMYPDVSATPGVTIRNNLHVGDGAFLCGPTDSTTPFGDNKAKLQVSGKTSTDDWRYLLQTNADLDSDVGSVTGTPFVSLSLAKYNCYIVNPFDITDGASGGESGLIIAHDLYFQASINGSAMFGTPSLTMLRLGAFNTSLHASSPNWVDLIGIDMSGTITVGSGKSGRTIGLLCTGTKNGTASWDAIFGTNGTQINTTGKFILGGSSTVKGVNYISRGGTSDIIMGVAALTNTHYRWNATAFLPEGTIRTQTLGQVTLEGWLGLFLQDTVADKTLQLKTTTTGTPADTILTIDPVGASRTAKLGGNVAFPSGSAYTPTNVTTDRAYDANATSIDELADVLGTLIADLQTAGVIT